MKLISIFAQQKQKFINECNNHEDKPVISFLNTLKSDINIKYLEVGSGLGRFPLKIRELFKNINIECLEINSDLAMITNNLGLKTVVSDVIFLPYQSKSFDIIHCSHVIEHFKYPEIIQVLEQLYEITKLGGYIIFRSPLMHSDFYLDIDHVRPYPPETILNYFKNSQQQKVGDGNLEVILCWYRRQNYKIFNNCNSKIKYFLNMFLAFLWTYIKFPFSKKNGYVLILQKKV
jgi:ubiquinone/menaquinone biosynthesis C-methylase UbiE